MPRTRTERRSIDGILLLDKPSGITSNAALQRVKALFQAAKAGHTGSLDPLATGLLPICFGEATKLSGYLLSADKRYAGRAWLGVKTDTADAQGVPVARSDPRGLTRQALEAAFSRMLGEQRQIPPMYSAIKREGQALYRLARRGVEVAREPREILIHELRLTAFDGDGFEFEVRCSKGTYVRTLVEDLAAAVGQYAHLERLRRLALGGLDGRDMVTLAQLQTTAAEHGIAALDRYLLPPLTALAGWPRIVADAARAFYLRQGQPVRFAAAPNAGPVAVVDEEGAVFAIGEVAADGRVAPRRILHRGN